MPGKLMFVDMVKPGEPVRFSAPCKAGCVNGGYCGFLTMLTLRQCTHCGERIGFLRLFYHEGAKGLIHLKCHEKREDQQKQPVKLDVWLDFSEAIPIPADPMWSDPGGWSIQEKNEWGPDFKPSGLFISKAQWDKINQKEPPLNPPSF